MTTAPLARDQQGNTFDLPEEAALWRVRLQTPGRPRTVFGRDGQPLFIPIASGAADLEDAGCESGSYRLEACNADRQPIEDAPVGVVELAGATEAIELAGGSRELVPVSVYSQPSRGANEAMVRVLEATERTRMERERHQADRERWQMQALVESQREMAAICRSLVKALRPQPAASDPVTILEQHIAAKKLLDKVGRRNAGVVVNGPVGDDDEKKPAEKHQILQLLENPSVLPFVSLATTAATQFVTKKMSQGDPEKYKELNRKINDMTNTILSNAGGSVTEEPCEAAAPMAGSPVGTAPAPSPAPTNLVTQEEFQRAFGEQTAAHDRVHAEALRALQAEVRNLRAANASLRRANAQLGGTAGALEAAPHTEPTPTEAPRADGACDRPTRTPRQQRIAEIIALLTPEERDQLTVYAKNRSEKDLDEIQDRLMTVTPEIAVTYLRAAVLPRSAA